MFNLRWSMLCADYILKYNSLENKFLINFNKKFKELHCLIGSIWLHKSTRAYTTNEAAEF